MVEQCIHEFETENKVMNTCVEKYSSKNKLIARISRNSHALKWQLGSTWQDTIISGPRS